MSPKLQNSLKHRISSSTSHKTISQFDNLPLIVNSGAQTKPNKKVQRKAAKSNSKRDINSFTFVDLMAPSFFANNYNPDILQPHGYNKLDYRINLQSLLIQKTDT